MLQPPANKSLFEVFLNCCQYLNDSQEQKYVCTARVFELREELLSQQICRLRVLVQILYIYVRREEGDKAREKRRRR